MVKVDKEHSFDGLVHAARADILSAGSVGATKQRKRIASPLRS